MVTKIQLLGGRCPVRTAASLCPELQHGHNHHFLVGGHFITAQVLGVETTAERISGLQTLLLQGW